MALVAPYYSLNYNYTYHYNFTKGLSEGAGLVGWEVRGAYCTMGTCPTHGGNGATRVVTNLKHAAQLTPVHTHVFAKNPNECFENEVHKRHKARSWYQACARVVNSNI